MPFRAWQYGIPFTAPRVHRHALLQLKSAAHGPGLSASCYTTHRVLQSYCTAFGECRMKTQRGRYMLADDGDEPLVQIRARYMLADAMGVRSCNATYYYGLV